MKFSIRSTFLVIPTVCFGLAAPVHALPFNSDCASMARFAKVILARDKSSVKKYDFTGFKGELKQVEGGQKVFCENGYMTETTPKGSLICDAYILFNTSDGSLTYSSGNYSREVKEAERRLYVLRQTGAARESAELISRYLYSNEADAGPPCRWK